MAVTSAKKILYVIKLASGPSVFCPMKDGPVSASKCVKCEWNIDKKIVRLPTDELRGIGYVSCAYAKE
jgi:hypothetical protein